MSQDGKALLDVLQRPLSPGNSESLTATANYSKAVSTLVPLRFLQKQESYMFSTDVWVTSESFLQVHCILDVVHEVLHHQRRLENIWQHRKVRLHQRLQLCVFQQDVQQVRAHKTANNGKSNRLDQTGTSWMHEQSLNVFQFCFHKRSYMASRERRCGLLSISV